MEKYCKSSREHATNVLNFEKTKMLPLTKEELKLHQDARNCYIFEKIILQKLAESKNYWKEIIPIIQVNIEVQHILFVV